MHGHTTTRRFFSKHAWCKLSKILCQTPRAHVSESTLHKPSRLKPPVPSTRNLRPHKVPKRDWEERSRWLVYEAEPCGASITDAWHDKKSHGMTTFIVVLGFRFGLTEQWGVSNQFVLCFFENRAGKYWKGKGRQKSKCWLWADGNQGLDKALCPSGRSHSGGRQF